MPLFWAKKEVFEWVRSGKKTIDIRKGKAFRGDIAVFQFGNQYVRLRISQKITGKLSEVISSENYTQVVPSARSVNEAFDYLHKIYGDYEGNFTAYYLVNK